MMNATINSIQKSIIKEFACQFKNYNGDLNLSVPLIPRISTEYLSNRTIVVGQETNTWYPYKNTIENLAHLFTKYPDELEKECLVNRYDKFVNEHVEKYGGKFWEFNRLLYSKKIISGNIVQNSSLTHCWINLFLTEAIAKKNHKMGRPTSNRQLAEEIIKLQGDLIARLFEILTPKRIIFLTGHSLDGYLFQTALKDVEVIIKPLDPNKVLTCNELAKFEIQDKNHVLFETDIVRTYHPSYFMGRINSRNNTSIRSRILKKGFTQSNSKYYIDTLLSYLKP